MNHVSLVREEYEAGLQLLLRSRGKGMTLVEKEIFLCFENSLLSPP